MLLSFCCCHFVIFQAAHCVAVVVVRLGAKRFCDWTRAARRKYLELPPPLPSFVQFSSLCCCCCCCSTIFILYLWTLRSKRMKTKGEQAVYRSLARSSLTLLSLSCSACAFSLSLLAFYLCVCVRIYVSWRWVEAAKSKQNEKRATVAATREWEGARERGRVRWRERLWGRRGKCPPRRAESRWCSADAMRGCGCGCCTHRSMGQWRMVSTVGKNDEIVNKIFREFYKIQTALQSSVK